MTKPRDQGRRPVEGEATLYSANSSSLLRAAGDPQLDAALPVEGGKPELGSGAQSASGGRSTNNASPYKDWWNSAKSDLAFARAGLKNGFYSQVCVLSQQAVEKAMKGYLVFLGKSYPKSHNLLQLHELMEIDWLKPHVGSLKKLSEFYVPLRYPDAAGTLPEGPPNEGVATKALRWAEEILAAIESHL